MYFSEAKSWLNVHCVESFSTVLWFLLMVRKLLVISFLDVETDFVVYSFSGSSGGCSVEIDPL